MKKVINHLAQLMTKIIQPEKLLQSRLIHYPKFSKGPPAKNYQHPQSIGSSLENYAHILNILVINVSFYLKEGAGNKLLLVIFKKILNKRIKFGDLFLKEEKGIWYI